MKNVKKMVALGLSLVLAVSVMAGCGSKKATEQSSDTQANSQTNGGGKIKIGVSLQNLQSAFPLYMMAGIQSYAEGEMPDQYEVVILNAEQKADLQVSQVETMISDGAAAIVINPVDKVGSAPCIQACVDAGIPVITVNTMVENQDLVTAHVGADDYEAGTLQMQAALELIGGRGNIAVLHGTLGHSAQVTRWAAYQDVVNATEGAKIVADQDSKWKTDIAQTITENWIQSDMDLDAIVCNNDTIAMGAANAIEASGKTGEIQVVGIDAIADALNMVKSGKISVTFDQNALEQGEWGVRLAIDAIEGKQIEDKFVEFIRIDTDTIEDFLATAEERDAILNKYLK